jgi:kynurenine formamidase
VSLRVPDFDELPTLEGLGLRHAWGVFGPDDQLGTINFLTPERSAAAARLVLDGTTVNLTLPLGAVDPPFYGREPMRHTVYRLDRNYWDDRIDNLHLQGSSHWDSLRHVQARELGWWGGVTDESQIKGGSGPLGIEHWVEHGMIGRGVLLDVGGHLDAGSQVHDPFASLSITPETLDATALAQGVEIREGDILCVRFGWIAKYRTLDAAGRRDLARGDHDFTGLWAGEEMARWLWNHRVAAVAADNPAVEVSPGDRNVGSLHRRVLPLLGLAVGELFDFERLAGLCAADRRWDFMFVSVPLNLIGGVGSPANAVAVR